MHDGVLKLSLHSPLPSYQVLLTVRSDYLIYNILNLSAGVTVYGTRTCNQCLLIIIATADLR